MTAPDERDTFQLDLAGQEWTISILRSELEEVHRPLLQELLDGATEKGGRYIVFLAGPPGCGKTATAALWEVLAPTLATPGALQALPMDGFHLPNEVLDKTAVRVGEQQVPLRELKGDPLSYDLGGLRRSLQALRGGEPLVWPRYDRKLHDPVPGAITPLANGVLVVEGNFLLLDEGRWGTLHALADISIFIDCDESALRHDKIRRLERGGRTPENALRHYDKIDRPNREKIMGQRIPPDIILRVEDDRRMRRVGG